MKTNITKKAKQELKNIIDNKGGGTMILNMETKRSLTALYVTVLVKNKYKQYDDLQERYKSHAEELDKLNVPWMLQNMTAGAADNPENWKRYNNSVIDEVIEKYNKIIENRRR